MLARVLLTFGTACCFSLRSLVSAEERAYVTVVTTDDYVEAAMIMGASLRAHTLRYEPRVREEGRGNVRTDYVCLALLKNTARGGAGVGMIGVRLLQAAGWSVRPIPYQIMNPSYVGSEERDEYAELVHVWNFNKLWVWGLTEYDKVVYLDSDLLVLGNIEHLFDRDIWIDRGGAFANSTHRNFAAAPDMIPPDKFNSGVMVLRPAMEVFDDMRDAALSGRISSYNKGDQGFLNAYFSDWYEMPVASRLPAVFNFAYAFAQYEPVWIASRSDIKIVHFYGDRKPWHLIKDPALGVPRPALPLLYLWGVLTFLAGNPTQDLEAESRYVCIDLFRINTDGAEILQYLGELKQGGTRRKRHRIKAPQIKSIEL